MRLNIFIRTVDLACVNEAETAFARGLGDIAALARDLRFGACSASFSRLGATASGYKHGAFVAGVLEGAFSGLESLLSRSGVPPRDRADAAGHCCEFGGSAPARHGGAGCRALKGSGIYST